VRRRLGYPQKVADNYRKFLYSTKGWVTVSAYDGVTISAYDGGDRFSVDKSLHYRVLHVTSMVTCRDCKAG
jgi:hypothetical protein